MPEPNLEMDVRVAHIMRLEARGEYGPATVIELAREWGMAIGSIRNLHSEAMRYIRISSAGNIDEERNTWLSRLHAVYTSAMQRESRTHIYNPALEKVEEFVWRDPDHKAAVQAIAQVCRVLGLGMFKKDELADREKAQLRDTLGKQDLSRLKADALEMVRQLERMEMGVAN